jgi:hypothetical protein
MLSALLVGIERVKISFAVSLLFRATRRVETDLQIWGCSYPYGPYYTLKSLFVFSMSYWCIPIQHCYYRYAVKSILSAQWSRYGSLKSTERIKNAWNNISNVAVSHSGNKATEIQQSVTKYLVKVLMCCHDIGSTLPSEFLHCDSQLWLRYFQRSSRLCQQLSDLDLVIQLITRSFDDMAQLFALFLLTGLQKSAKKATFLSTCWYREEEFLPNKVKCSTLLYLPFSISH